MLLQNHSQSRVIARALLPDSFKKNVQKTNKKLTMMKVSMIILFFMTLITMNDKIDVFSTSSCVI